VISSVRQLRTLCEKLLVLCETIPISIYKYIQEKYSNISQTTTETKAKDLTAEILKSYSVVYVQGFNLADLIGGLIGGLPPRIPSPRQREDRNGKDQNGKLITVSQGHDDVPAPVSILKV